MSRVQLQPAFVLHGRPYRESSQLLEAFSRDHGRIGIVARGARGARSRWRLALQPFRPLLLSWTQRGELATLTGADQVAAPPALQGEELFCGFYVNEITLRFLHRGDPHPELFERYRSVLGRLAAGGAIQCGLRLYEKHLLEATGFGMTLDCEHDSREPIRAEAWYEYRPELGPVRVAEQSRDRAGVISGRALLSLSSEDLSQEDLPALRRLMRRVLRHHLGERPLSSEALFWRRSGSGRRSPQEVR